MHLHRFSQPHLGDVRNRISLDLSGAGELWGSRVEDLYSDRDQQPGSKRHTFPESVVQVLVLVHQSVLPSGAVHVHPGRSQSGQKPWGQYTTVRNKHKYSSYTYDMFKLEAS